MGSGGSQTLWSPSYEAGAYGKYVLKINTVHFHKPIIRRAMIIHLQVSMVETKTVIDGGTLKRE